MYFAGSRKTKSEWLKKGIDPELLKVRYGFRYGRTYNRGRLIRHSKICMFSWKFRIMRFIHALLAKQHGQISTVVVVENNVFANFNDLDEFSNLPMAHRNMLAFCGHVISRCIRKERRRLQSKSPLCKAAKFFVLSAMAWSECTRHYRK